MSFYVRHAAQFRDRVAGRVCSHRVGWLGVLLLVWMLTWSVVAAEGLSVDYQVKASFLVKLSQFVDWPARVFPSPETPVCIGIVGNDPLGAQLDEAVARERLNGRPVRVVRVSEIASARECHILFLAAPEMERLPELARQLGALPVLTVGEHPRFAYEGGILNFTKEDGHLRFEVNRAAATKAGLRISAKFLQVARVIEPDQVSGRTGG